MQKVSVKKLSILGLVLMAASAVTAAIIPSKSSSDSNNFAPNATLSVSNNGGVSCKPTAVTVKTCFDTPTGAGSNTTDGLVASAENGTTGSDND